MGHHPGVARRRQDYASPEAAALSSWTATPGARASIRSVVIKGNRAEVVLDIGPDRCEWSYSVRDRDGWHETVSGNGPTVGWDDPAVIDWQ
jgi:hypothetical protein